VPHEAVDRDRPDVDPGATVGRRRALRRDDLGRQVCPLPGDEHAVGPEQRERQVDEPVEACHGAGDDRRPATPVGRVAGERLGALGGHRGAIAKTGRRDGRPEERRLLRDRLDEHGAVGRQGRRERKSREATAAADVQQLVDPEVPQDRDGGQAVDDMAECDRLRLADAGQVDRGVPGDQQPDVAVDGRARRGSQGQVELGKAGVEGGLVPGWEPREVIDARRERLARAVQAPLLSVVPRGRPAARSRRRRSSHRSSSIGLPELVRFAAGFPRAPRGPRYPR
jgi:hypothetical protein